MVESSDVYELTWVTFLVGVYGFNLSLFRAPFLSVTISFVRLVVGYIMMCC